MAEVFNPSSQEDKKRLTWEMAEVPHNWDKAKCPIPRPDTVLGPRQRERFLCGRYMTINIPSNGGGVWPMTLIDSWADGCFLYFHFVHQRDVGLMGVAVRAAAPQTLVA